MNNLQISIIYASIIGSLINEWSPSESTKAINEVKSQVKKFMYKRSRSNTKDFNDAIKKGHAIWGLAIDKFAQEKLRIDAYSTVIAIWSNQADLLSKFVNLTQKRIDKFSMNSPQDHSLESEQNAYKVAAYLTKLIDKEALC